jgi:hypothetical protein
MIEEQGATPNIPAKSNRKWKPCFSKRLYRERNLIERFFSKLKHFRRVATRYDKIAANFLAMVQLASIRLWLRAYESTAYDALPGAADGINLATETTLIISTRAGRRPTALLSGSIHANFIAS